MSIPQAGLGAAKMHVFPMGKSTVLECRKGNAASKPWRGA